MIVGNPPRGSIDQQQTRIGPLFDGMLSNQFPRQAVVVVFDEIPIHVDFIHAAQLPI